jgi:hypothetical protein
MLRIITEQGGHGYRLEQPVPVGSRMGGAKETSEGVSVSVPNS